MKDLFAWVADGSLHIEITKFPLEDAAEAHGHLVPHDDRKGASGTLVEIDAALADGSSPVIRRCADDSLEGSTEGRLVGKT